MKQQFYVGSYGRQGEQSILHLQADFEKGELDTLMADTQAYCPSYLLMHPNGRVLYAVRELTDEGALYTFLIGEDTLRLVSVQPTLGKDPCFLSLDENGQVLVAVNYSGSSLAVFRLNGEGIPVELKQHIVHEGQSIHPIRQTEAHPHCAVWEGQRCFVCDLGTDQVVCYALEDGCVLRRESHISMPAGSGPRHLCMGERDDVMYVVGELSSSVFVMRRTEIGWVQEQEISTLSDGFSGESTAAAIKLSGDRKVLFVSNRGDDSIAAFRILESGRLEKAHVCKTGGATPRDFAVFGDYLVAANQDSDCLSVLAFDLKECRLRLTGIKCPAVKPTMILKI